MRKAACTCLVVGLLLPGAAWAGSGPWTLSPDDFNAFTGLSYTRFRHFVGGEGKGAGDIVELASAVTRTDLNVELTYGLLRGAEVELATSLAWSAVARDEEGDCAVVHDLCDTTFGLAPVRVRAKVRILDEWAGMPLTVAFGPEVRFADYTRSNRQRVTSIGEGQTDLGGFVTLGRVGPLGSWSYATFVEAVGRYRVPVTTFEGVAAPPSEVQLFGEYVLHPIPSVSMGVAFDWVQSLGGQDFGDVPMDDPDRFTSLSITSLKLGGKLNIRSVGNVTLSVSALGTLWARNNPTDYFTLGFGIGTFRPSRRAR